MRFSVFTFFVLIILPFSVLAFTAPAKPLGFIGDYASILTLEQVNLLEEKLWAFEKSTTNEIAVVTISSLDGDVIENVAQEIFTKWGIGKKNKNNGVLLLISLADRKTRIQTGYGVEGDLTDIATSYIQSDIITPAFRSGDYYAGINGAVDKIIQALDGNDIVPADYYVPPGPKIPWNTVIILVIIGFQILSSILARSKSWWGGGVLGGIVGLAVWHFFIASIFAAVPLIVLFVGAGFLFDFGVSRAYTQGKATGRYPWWFGGGGFGGGGQGGGFGGFGGGGSGGGGSSGGW